MKTQLIKWFVVTGALFILAAPAFGQQLNRATVNNWADSMEELERWGDRQGRLNDDYAGAEDPGDFQSALARIARQDREVQRIIERNGFASGSEWATVGSQIFNAYLALQMREQEPEMQREFQEQIDAIEENPHLNEDQRRQMRAQMEEMMSMMGDVFTAPEEDIAAVEANRSRLDRLFDNE